MIIVLMGVAGCGKTTVGRALAEELGWPFYDGDDFHTAANVEKMRGGVALTDADREEWLDALRRVIDESLAKNKSAVVACSALKEKYRKRLGADVRLVRFVFLKGDYDFILKRMNARKGHYFGSALLASQFAALEEPSDAVVVNAQLGVSDAVAVIRERLEI